MTPVAAVAAAAHLEQNAAVKSSDCGTEILLKASACQHVVVSCRCNGFGADTTQVFYPFPFSLPDDLEIMKPREKPLFSTKNLR